MKELLLKNLVDWFKFGVDVSTHPRRVLIIRTKCESSRGGWGESHAGQTVRVTTRNASTFSKHGRYVPGRTPHTPIDAGY